MRAIMRKPEESERVVLHTTLSDLYDSVAVDKDELLLLRATKWFVDNINELNVGEDTGSNITPAGYNGWYICGNMNQIHTEGHTTKDEASLSAYNNREEAK